MKLTLASASPRRRELLELLRLPFEVVVSNVDEDIAYQGQSPAELVQSLALSKAKAVADGDREGLVIGADTVVVYNGKILGKPEGRQGAFDMLKALSGREHQVLTGIALVDKNSGKEYVTAEVTYVKFKELSYKEINAYIDTGEPFDKAGAYGIQGLASVFIEGIRGDYFNVVGLPIHRLAEMLKSFGIDVI